LLLSLFRFSVTMDIRFGGSYFEVDGYFLGDDRLLVEWLFRVAVFIVQ
jgi:hypothetical protein